MNILYIIILAYLIGCLLTLLFWLGTRLKFGKPSNKEQKLAFLKILKLTIPMSYVGLILGIIILLRFRIWNKTKSHG